MRNVVERCPACGVVHEVSADSLCEVCHTPLRAWCRVHGRETGWLNGPGCPRCAQEAARPAPPSRAPALPCPDFSHATVSAARPGTGSAPPASAAVEAERPGVWQPKHRLAVLIMIMLMNTGGGAMLGVIAGFLYVFADSGAPPGAALRFTLAGAVLGALSGVAASRSTLRQLRTPPPEP